MINQENIEQLAFVKRHRVDPRIVRFSDSGHAYYQELLAAELLVKSTEIDRSLHALKWLMVAGILKQDAQVRNSWTRCLAEAMGLDQFELVTEMVEAWFQEKSDEFDQDPEAAISEELKAAIKRGVV